MVPLAVDSSTLAITSIVSVAITYSFCRALEISSGGSIGIAAVVGIILFSTGIIPIGLLIVVGIAMLGFIFKKGPPK
jgi:hypothetical protein